MEFNKLIPELSVTNYEASLAFYKMLGFKVEYTRDGFAYLSFQGSQIMINEGNNGKNSPWFTGKLEHPCGRGIHFQFEVDKIQPILDILKKNNYPIKVKPKEYWFKAGSESIGMLGFLIMDPDGYLLMFNEDIDTKQV